MDRSIHLLCLCDSLHLYHHCQQLCPFFDTKFHYLLKGSHPVTSELLGDNIDQKVSESVKISEAALKLQFNNRSQMHGKPRFQNYRHSQGRGIRHPYSGLEDRCRQKFQQNFSSFQQFSQNRGSSQHSRSRGHGHS